ncbi:hypothetical protein [Paucisalibacillus globulus]|uniref:hypothetical protein n=1 Tax=Paucisalibacillus globulus TaxID=351095 RepID=UPI000BB830E7|nr:hypothetical protein [Paucisalibacillus globulus]
MALPFINKESSVLCNQPLVELEEGAEPLELTNLSEVFCYPRHSIIKNKLMQCKLYNTNVFFIGEGMKDRKKYTRIYVNPFVAGRSAKAPNTSLLEMFPDTEKAIVKNHKEKRK